jgi:hypothetical protein
VEGMLKRSGKRISTKRIDARRKEYDNKLREEVEILKRDEEKQEIVIPYQI